MKLSIHPGPGPAIQIRDAIVFTSSGATIAHASRGNFDSRPYEPKHQSWSYTAALHLTDGGRLAVAVTEKEKTVTLVDGQWKRSVDARTVWFSSEDQGATWSPSSEPDRLTEPLHTVSSS